MHDEIVAHALADAPNECCGLIGTRDGVGEIAHPVENGLHTPFAFEMEPRAQYRAWKAIEDAELEPGAMYHSHTRSDPEPSQADLNMAIRWWPDPVWVIVGVKDPDAPAVRAWRLLDGVFGEAALEVG